MKANKILVLAPHTDDAELGCGGSIARWVEEGSRVSVVAFSSAEESLPEGYSPDTLRREFMRAMPKLGVDSSLLRVFGFPVRRLSYHRQEVLEEMVKIRRSFEPEMVVLPSVNDVHQDHQVVHAEGMRAFKDISILGYELPWNHVNFSAQAFVTLKQDHIEKKWAALEEYKSQFEIRRNYLTRSFIEGLATVRGAQVKEEFAEAFEVYRLKFI